MATVRVYAVLLLTLVCSIGIAARPAEAGCCVITITGSDCQESIKCRCLQFFVVNAWVTGNRSELTIVSTHRTEEECTTEGYGFLSADQIHCALECCDYTITGAWCNPPASDCWPGYVGTNDCWCKEDVQCPG